MEIFDLIIILKGTLNNQDVRSRSRHAGIFADRRPARSALGVHMFDIPRIKFRTQRRVRAKRQFFKVAIIIQGDL